MKEYKTKTFVIYHNDEKHLIDAKIQELLNGVAADGWELKNMINSSERCEETFDGVPVSYKLIMTTIWERTIKKTASKKKS